MRSLILGSLVSLLALPALAQGVPASGTPAGTPTSGIMTTPSAPIVVGPHSISLDDLNKQIEQTNFLLELPDGLCSATLINLEYKLVLTNNHCVQDAISQVTKDDTSEGEVKSKTFEVWHDMPLSQKAYKDFTPVGKTSLQSELIAHEAKYDLAIIQIKADKIPQSVAAKVAGPDFKIERGDPIYVVGNPLELDANLTKGIISSTTRRITWEDGTDVPYYGVDAGVNPGNSGGALYSADGTFIGVPGAGIRGATGMGFAIPLSTVQKFLKENCYEDVYNPAAKKHDACEADKLADLNKARDKKGLTPLKEMPVSHLMTTGERPVTQDKTGLLPNTKILGPVYER